VVLALTNHQRLHALANARGRDVPLPWPRFIEDVRERVDQITVSHRAMRGVRGALHEATFFGATQKNEEPSTADRPWAKDWIEDASAFVRRKPVVTLTKVKQVMKVRDKAIREILLGHLRKQGIDVENTDKIQKDAFTGANIPRMPSGVPIRRVRLVEESTTSRRVSTSRQFQYVKPGSNHHIVYRATGQGQGERWIAEVVAMWDACGRALRGEPLVNRVSTEQARFVMSLSIGEMFEMIRDDGEIICCVVRKIDQPGRRMHYKLHTDARPAGEIKKDNLCKSPDKLRLAQARKITVDALGQIRDAAD
jgi:CRISPR-associated endonuclease Csn1